MRVLLIVTFWPDRGLGQESADLEASPYQAHAPYLLPTPVGRLPCGEQLAICYNHGVVVTVFEA